MAERWPADFAGGADPLALVERVLAESVVTHHPGYVGHQLAAPLPLAALGTLVTAVTNGSGAIYELSQSSTACEAALARHLAGRLGLPATAGGMIVHGGTIATLTALLAARQAQAGFDVWRDGAHAGPPLALLASDQTHYSTRAPPRSWASARPARSRSRATSASACGPRRSPPRSPRRATRGLRPIAVVATAGTTPTGAFDPLEAIADICAAEGLWLHVDAAHGGSAALSPALAPQLAGIGRADSVVWDLHKTLPFPALASLLAYARARDAYGAFAQKADYLFRSDDPGAENMGTRTLECTRPQLALVAYLGFAAVGAEGLRAHVERLWELGAVLAELVRESGDFELALEPECNIVCFRHRAPDGADSDAHQERIRSERQRERELLPRADAAARRDLAALRTHERRDDARRPARAARGATRRPPCGSDGAPARARRARAAAAARRARGRARPRTPGGGRCDRRARRGGRWRWRPRCRRRGCRPP